MLGTKGTNVLKILSFLLIFTWLACEEDSKRVMTSGTTPASAPPGADADRAGTGEGNATPENNDSDLNGDNDVDLAITYAEVVAPAIDEACVACHNDTGAASFLPLDSQQVLMDQIGDDTDPATNPFLARLDDDANPMPPSADRDERERILELLQEWADNGFE